MSTETPRAPLPPRPAAPPRVPAQPAGPDQGTPPQGEPARTEPATPAGPAQPRVSGAPSPVLPFGDVRFTAGGRLVPYSPRPTGAAPFDRGPAPAPFRPAPAVPLLPSAPPGTPARPPGPVSAAADDRDRPDDTAPSGGRTTGPTPTLPPAPPTGSTVAGADARTGTESSRPGGTDTPPVSSPVGSAVAGADARTGTGSSRPGGTDTPPAVAPVGAGSDARTGTGSARPGGEGAPPVTGSVVAGSDAPARTDSSRPRPESASPEAPAASVLPALPDSSKPPRAEDRITTLPPLPPSPPSGAPPVPRTPPVHGAPAGGSAGEGRAGIGHGIGDRARGRTAGRPAAPGGGTGVEDTTPVPRPGATNSPFPTPYLIAGSRTSYAAYAPPPGAPPAPTVPPRFPPLPARPPETRTGPAAPGVFPWDSGAAETASESTARLRPVPVRRPGRAAVALACVVLGLGLIGGAVTGSWLTGDSAAEPADRDDYTVARSLWHSVPVDTLFPRTLKGEAAGPGGADRQWTRTGVAPDTSCAEALGPVLDGVLRPLGCTRVVRATYTDATASSVTTVGLVFTQGDETAMAALRTRFRANDLTERADMMPHAFPVEDTAAATFGDGQRASWTVNVLTEVPVVVYAVTGFADGRPVSSPQPADQAIAGGATTPAAQAGLGHEAKGIADRIERGLRKAVSTGTAAPR
ncbi:hypothetical protein AB0O07_24835 [Streptomyces sp. NPDC093085]|uniref:hypothetical protein n=1 Tax=Streptomyces sp. NPDC093085 TaxID=3155068 RepID=UPI003421DB55